LIEQKGKGFNYAEGLGFQVRIRLRIKKKKDGKINKRGHKRKRFERHEIQKTKVVKKYIVEKRV
jgi:hypothetical protein